MAEKETTRTFSNKVREYSRNVIDTLSNNIISIDYNSVELNLLSKLRDFQKSSKSEQNFVDTTLTAENELGLNLFLNVVNFCYKNPFTSNEYKYKNRSGEAIKRATGLKAAMTDADVNWGSLVEVAGLNDKKWSEIVQLENNKDFYLGADRGSRITEMAGKMLRSFNNISEFLEFAEYDAEKVLPILGRSGYFTDEFQKRSQLAVSMMNGVLKSRFQKELKGVDSLTVMADYRLPQVMYNFGAIELSSGLKDNLMKHNVIESGSPEELSLRAASVLIGERLSKLMGINENDVDQLLWTLSQKMSAAGELKIPHMLVATDKY